MLHGLIRTRTVAARFPHGYAVARQHRHLLTLGIETSCDDTCVAILSTPDGPEAPSAGSTPPEVEARLHFHQKITTRNTGHGGIHPLEALESHRTNLSTLVDQAIAHLPLPPPGAAASKQTFHRDGSSRVKPDFISVTRGPGMRSNLNVGLDTAKGLATAWQIPIIGVHHMQAHALTPRLVQALQGPASRSKLKPSFPFLTLLLSGGHTLLLYSHDLTTHIILADTIDIAIGDCLDKCGRSILPESTLKSSPDTAYAKYLSNFAFPTPADFDSYPIPLHRRDEINKPLNKYGWALQPALSAKRDLAFSFAGIPSHVHTLATSKPLSTEERLHLARTTLGTAFEHIGSRTIIALELLRSKPSDIEPETKTLVVSGGVAANQFLRHFLRKLLDARGFTDVELIFPPVELCTDNAAMIAWAGIEMYRAGWRSTLSCDARKKWSMDANCEDGGILGVGGWYRAAEEPEVAVVTDEETREVAKL